MLEIYLAHSQTSVMELFFAKIVKGKKPLNVLTKSSTTDDLTESFVHF